MGVIRERGRGWGRGRGEELERIVCETDFIVAARWHQIVMLLGKSIETDLQINPLARSDNEVRTGGKANLGTMPT